MVRSMPKKATPKKGLAKQSTPGEAAPLSTQGRITVPEELGSSLRLMPIGSAAATLEKLMPGQSRARHPKLTFRYVTTEEMENVPEGEPTTIGEPVLESYSLQPQAMWKLNDTYKAVTGERLPQGDYSEEEFVAMLNEVLTGTEWNLVLDQQIPGDGSSSELRTVITAKSLR